MIDERYFTPNELTAKLDSHYNSGAYISGVKKYEVALREYRKLFEYCEDLEDEIGKLESEIRNSEASEIKKQYEKRIKAVKDELDVAKTALAIKKQTNEKLNRKIDGLKADNSHINYELNKLKQESVKLFEDLSSLLSASSELFQYLDPLEVEEAKKLFENAGFDVKDKYEITVRTYDYWNNIEPVYGSKCSWELRLKD